MPVDLDDDNNYQSNHDYTDIDTNHYGSPNRKRNIIIFVVAIGVVLAVLAIILGVTLGTRSKKNNNSGGNTPVNPVRSLSELVELPNLMNNLEILNGIAEQHSNSRAVDFGYNESATWVFNQIKEHTDFDVSYQYFTLDEYETQNPAKLSSFINNMTTDYTSSDFRDMGNFDGMLTITKNLSVATNLGCNSSDFGTEVSGTIVLVHRGNCTFSEKVRNAHTAGAEAILIYNTGNQDETAPFLGGFDSENPIPTFSLSFSLGDVLKTFFNDQIPVEITLTIDMKKFTRTTMNIIADTKEGDPNKVIVTGSHLDSVPAGPGINDNGSGSSTNLEMAKALYQLKEHNEITIKQKVRFAWWAAEEEGLLGSTYYVQNLVDNDPDELKKIVLNLNYDMLGSPNYYYAIYDGKGAAENIRTASEKIQELFQDYFIGIGESFALTPFDGRSDYGPFIQNNIPAGGLFSGAEKIKSIDERAKFGGIANTAFDPCYHQFCDDLKNIEQGGYATMAKSAAEILQVFTETNNIEELLGGDMNQRDAKRDVKNKYRWQYSGPKVLY